MASREERELAFKLKAVKVHGDKYDYSYIEYVNTDKKVQIWCNKCKKFFTQSPYKHIMREQGCKKCGIDKRAKGRTYSREEVIALCKARHGDRYDYSNLVYIKGRLPMEIICKEHGPFWQTLRAHTVAKEGCPACAGVERNTAESYIEKAKKVHGDTYDYSNLVYSRDAVNIVCPTHGEFIQTASNHLAGKGCNECKGSGFDSSKPAILYYLEVDEGRAYKIGVTNRTVVQRFTAMDLGKIKVLNTVDYDVGADAYKEEQRILKEFKEFKYVGEDLLSSGNTELFCKNVLEVTDV